MPTETTIERVAIETPQQMQFLVKYAEQFKS